MDLHALSNDELTELLQFVPRFQHPAFIVAKDKKYPLSKVVTLTAKDVSTMQSANPIVQKEMHRAASLPENTRMFEAHKPAKKAAYDLQAELVAANARKNAVQNTTSATPDFIVLGAPKSATNWLYSCLHQHKDIFLPKRKEPEYFSDERYNFGTDWYANFFTDYENQSLKGDMSVGYLASPFAPERIQKTCNENVKLIAILREPVSRAISYFKYRLLAGDIPTSMQEALYIPYLRYLYIENGLYGNHIERYLQHFKKEQIFVLLTEEIQKDPQDVYKRVCSFLEIDNTDIPSDIHTKSNSGKYVRNPMLHFTALSLAHSSRAHVPVVGNSLRKHIKKLNNTFNMTNNGHMPALETEARELLKDTFSESNQKLSDLLNIDLSNWR